MEAQSFVTRIGSDSGERMPNQAIQIPIKPNPDAVEPRPELGDPDPIGLSAGAVEVQHGGPDHCFSQTEPN